MARQIHFHMLSEDLNSFLRFAQRNDRVVLVGKNGCKNPSLDAAQNIPPDCCEIFWLWNPRLLRALQRTWLDITDPAYYTLATTLPILEFSAGYRAQWGGKPGLIQGRLYGQLDPDLEKPPEFAKWYESLVRWIRKNCRRHPSHLIGGYVGPAAYEFYENGGYLLPNFLPPKTDAWLAELSKQHPIDTLAVK